MLAILLSAITVNEVMSRAQKTMNKRTAAIVSGIFSSAAIFYPRAAHAIPVGELMKMPIPKQAVIVIARIEDVKNALRSEKIRDGTLKSPDRMNRDEQIAECIDTVFTPRRTVPIKRACTILMAVLLPRNTTTLLLTSIVFWLVSSFKSAAPASLFHPSCNDFLRLEH